MVYTYRTIFLLLVLCAATGVFPSLSFSARGEEGPRFDEYPLPKSVSLCGESLPLKDPYVREMLDREFTVSVWDTSQVFMWLKRAGRFFPHIEKELARAGMPDDLKYLAVAESSLLTRIQSNKGAMGTWQFMADTARRHGLRKDQTMDERRDFEQSTDAALRYLRRLKDEFGQWTLALAAYNCGEARLREEIEVQRLNDFYRLSLPPETERFIFRIAVIKIIMENPGRYGYNLDQERIHRPVQCDSVQISVQAPIHLTEVAFALGTDLKTIKVLNPQILGYHLPTGQYRINVPTGLGSRMKPVLEQLARTAAPPNEAVPEKFYVVQPGDTLTQIGKRTGVSLDTIRKLNGINGSQIEAGQTIKLRP